MTNHVLALEWMKCPDGATLLLDKQGRPEWIKYRSHERQRYKRRLLEPDDLIAAELINTGTSGPRKKTLPDNEATALREFVAAHGIPYLYAFTVEACEIRLDPSTSRYWEPRKNIVWTDRVRVSDLLWTRHILASIWGSVEREDLDDAVTKFNRAVRMTIPLWPNVRFHQNNPALMLHVQDLYSFMIMETGLILGGGIAIMRCQHCSVVFQTGSGTRRRNTAQYCSNKCRVAARRARKSKEG